MFIEYYLPIKPGNHGIVEIYITCRKCRWASGISQSFRSISNVCLGESAHVSSVGHLISSSPPASAPADLSPPSLLPTEDT